MEIIRLFNPKLYAPHEASIIESNGKGYLQIKSLLDDKTVFNGIYKNVNYLIEELIIICKQNDWYAQPMGTQENRKFESFYDQHEN